MVEGPGFFDRPFPSSSRMVDGHPDVSGFPGEGGFPIVDAYLGAAAAIDGFGNNSPLYVRFEAPIDPELLPSPEASLALDAPIFLVDVDGASPERGRRVPLHFEWTEEETTFQPGNLLAAAPLFGFPLRPGNQYALMLRSPLALPVEQAWGTDAPADLVPVQETLSGLGIDPETVSLAIPFTTQDPLRETARVARMIQDELGIPPIGQELEEIGETSEYTIYRGAVLLPVWQHGERPYRTEGGDFAFDEAGRPLIAFWERVSFALTIPKEDPPADGWPVVLYSHGTGGSYQSFCNSGANEEEATVFARQGVAVIGVSQPLHSDRAPPGTNPDLDSFNYANPYAGRTNFRQGALDQVYLAEVLTREVPTFSHRGNTVQLDPERVAYFGHSQGGLVGAIAAPFLGDRVVAAGFSGTGGGLAMTIVLRKDPLDIAQVLAAALGFSEDEELTTFHPVVGLVQMLSEATDPLNYGPYWFAESPVWPASPVPIVLTEGLLDAATPSVTTEALAAAARVPIVGEPATDPEALELRGLGVDELPTEGNALDWNGDPITAGLGQFEDNDHYAIYQNRDALQLYRDMIVSALDGEPRFDD
jgi:pimeloyl-ACP methyl ester carboxylesterase